MKEYNFFSELGSNKKVQGALAAGLLTGVLVMWLNKKGE